MIYAIVLLIYMEGSPNSLNPTLERCHECGSIKLLYIVNTKTPYRNDI